MTEINEHIARLEKRLENLVKTQVGFQQEITAIRSELAVLRQSSVNASPFDEIAPQSVSLPVVEIVESPPLSQIHQNQEVNYKTEQPQEKPASAYFPNSVHQKTQETRQTTNAPDFQSAAKSNLERFIGENLISKIGIVILVLGVGIGAKYAIDNNLISPVMRIILGYAFGFGLLGFAYKLREKYLNFSAVLLSGAMAIMYFITYFAYALYELFPQTTAFVLMLIFTIFTVVSALVYNRQVIAQIGLVGAYAIPFLLSSNSGNYAFLFAYTAIINAGILAVSVKKYWKSLHFSSFIVTWLIYAGWYVTKYDSGAHFNLALLFLTVNFLTFYVTFIVYKVINLKHVAVENISLIVSNSFIFYGFGYAILTSRAGFENVAGLFTVANAAIHFLFAYTISRLKIVPKDLVYLLSALIVTFATIAVPVQLDGNFVTLIWTVEAAVLFWIGRTKEIRVFEIYSFPLMTLASAGLLLDWTNVVASRDLAAISNVSYPFYNGALFTGLFFAAAFVLIYLTNRVKEYKSVLDDAQREIFGIFSAAIFLFVLYNALRIEISNYFHFLTVTTAAPPNGSNLTRYDQSLDLFNIIWQINYTMLFLSILSFVNIARVKSLMLAATNLVLNLLALCAFVSVGLYVLGGLREIYLLPQNGDVFQVGAFHLLIRYVSYAFVAVLFAASYLYLKQDFVKEQTDEKTFSPGFDFAFFTSLWIILSSELLHLTNVYGVADADKLGLSILWGIYALVLVVLGIYRSKKHLRLGAIALFGITLFKLFFYDITELDTISKTIVFVSLGILLLIASFLYTKYKVLIFGEEVRE